MDRRRFLGFFGLGAAASVMPTFPTPEKIEPEKCGACGGSGKIARSVLKPPEPVAFDEDSLIFDRPADSVAADDCLACTPRDKQWILRPGMTCRFCDWSQSVVAQEFGSPTSDIVVVEYHGSHCPRLVFHRTSFIVARDFL